MNEHDRKIKSHGADPVVVLRQKLGDDVWTAGHQKVQRMSIIGRDIALLRRRIAQPVARLKEEFLHPDVVGQRPVGKPGRVVERRICPEEAVHRRAKKSHLKITVRNGPPQRQGGDYVQMNRAIFKRQIRQGVGDRIRLAQSQRQREQHIAAGPLDNPSCNRRRVIQKGRPPDIQHRSFQPGSRRKRAPWASAKSSRRALISSGPRDIA